MSVKRTIDLTVAGAGLLILSPVMAGVAGAIWLSDHGSPFYSAFRIGLGGRPFKMHKFRSMILDADRIGASSTGNRDPRLTKVGRAIRAVKLDELPQLFNVLRGEMSLVGPRPNLAFAVEGYTAEERRLLDVRPGITDIASIVFADEGAILAEEPDPDLAYEQLIRPGKSRLGVFYVDHASARMDIAIVIITILNGFSRRVALSRVQHLLRNHGASEDLLRLASRKYPLQPAPPLGLNEVVAQTG